MTTKIIELLRECQARIDICKDFTAEDERREMFEQLEKVIGEGVPDEEIVAIECYGLLFDIMYAIKPPRELRSRLHTFMETIGTKLFPEENPHAD